MTEIRQTIESTRSLFDSPELWADLDTPCTIIASDVVERNIQRMAEYCQQHGIALRPHTKTHKSKRIAQLQLDAGAAGLTVAKPGEAKIMAELGADVLIAYPSVTRASLEAVRVGLAAASMSIAIDSAEAATRLDDALADGDVRAGVLVDIDVGMHRTGVQTADESVELAKHVKKCKHLRLDGIFCYPGFIWSPAEEQSRYLAEVESLIQIHLTRWRAGGLEARIISGGSTPTAFRSHLAPSINEIRPGTYVFNDMNTFRGGFCTLEDCAVRIVATVVSTAVPGQVVIDAGTKTLAADQCISAPDSGHGLIVEYPDARITHLSEEHGQADVSNCAKIPHVGERVSIVPNHVCPTINLTDFVWWLSEGSAERLTIDARGKVR